MRNDSSFARSAGVGASPFFVTSTQAILNTFCDVAGVATRRPLAATICWTLTARRVPEKDTPTVGEEPGFHEPAGLKFDGEVTYQRVSTWLESRRPNRYSSR